MFGTTLGETILDDQVPTLDLPKFGAMLVGMLQNLRRSRAAMLFPARRCAASARPAAPAPRAAMQPPRRQAWLRIFVVGCSLPCDPPVGGHSCNGGMIPRFHCAVCD